MPIELECKLKVESHAAIRERLRAQGATRIAEVLEINHMFDSADGSLRGAGRGLRLREIRPAGRAEDAIGAIGEDLRAVLTYKGPVQSGAFKAREEIEVGVSDGRAALALLAALGFVEGMCFEKRRERWRLGDCHVELDELPHLGCFIEVEGPNDVAVRGALERLALDALPQERATYAALVQECCRSRNLDCRAFRFSLSS